MPVIRWKFTGAPVSNALSTPLQDGFPHHHRSILTLLRAPASSTATVAWRHCRRGRGSWNFTRQLHHTTTDTLPSVSNSSCDVAHGKPGAAARMRPRGTMSLCSAASSASPNSGGAAGSAFGDPNTLVGLLMAYAVQLQQQQQADTVACGAEIRVESIGFHPPGSEKPLLENINMTLPANSLGLVMGRSGSGKTTLLQVLAGLTEQTSGHIRILHGGTGTDYGAFSMQPGSSAASMASVRVQMGGAVASNGVSAGSSISGTAAAGLTVEERMQQVGLVFQFPERHFLGEDLMQELTFTWPRLMQHWAERQTLSARMRQVLQAVGLEDIPMHVQPWALSGGQQRRLALAIQLVRQPALLLLDEPLAGLDWVARQEVVTILQKLKEQCTVLVVSHDLAEIAPLVDCAWRMRIGGTCEPVAWPPADLAGLEQ
ncbi:hypothetical protein Vretimale_8313 [Volvox reticuliferus]|uniref:ABC transporter domain-containing protein n=1 Tax=Volvox reticuliferus TaxID=1737510 RepID=A0A8J4GB59_9CHLO|nr:hypothetical protein Vretimale_8313 [Volvox reticuliferus]